MPASIQTESTGHLPVAIETEIPHAPARAKSITLRYRGSMCLRMHRRRGSVEVR